MIEWRITLTTNVPPPLASSEAFQNAMKVAMHSAGRLWLTKYLPMHFESGAAGRYGYKPRSRGFERRKQNVTKQPPIPMVFFDALYPSYGRTLKTTVLTDATTGRTRINKEAKNGIFALSIPVRFPHAMHPSISSSTLGPGRGEVVRLIKNETADMAKAINTSMTQQMKLAPVAQVTRVVR